jgi:alpha-glucosidase
MLALPGSAYIYQGEELGLPEVTQLPDEVRQDPAFFRRTPGSDGQDGLRDGCRVPIPWTADGGSYGFGEGGSWLPQPPGWGELSVARQTGDPASTLELYRTALVLRRELAALGAGDGVEWLTAPDGVLAFRRRGADGTGVVCVTNTTGGEVTLPGVLGALAASCQVLLTSGEHPGGGTVAADTTVWWAA